MSQLRQPRISLEEELSTLSAELIEAFMKADTQTSDETDIRDLLKSYIRHVTRCGLCAGRSGLTELEDYFVQFQAILKSLAQHPPEVINKYRNVLEEWPLLVMSYMNSTDKAEFIQQIEQLLEATEWPDKNTDAVSTTQSEDIVDLQNTESPAVDETDINSILHAGLLEEFGLIFEDLVSLSQDEARHEFNNVKQVLTETAGRLELFGISAASSGLIGLMDIAQILQTGLRTRSERTDILSEQEWVGLFSVKTAIVEYLKEPFNLDVIDNLIDSIQQHSMNESLPAAEIQTLRSLLILPEPQSEPEPQRESESVSNNDEIVSDTALSDSSSESDTISSNIQTEADISDVQEPQQTLSAESDDLLQLIASEFENIITNLTTNLQLLFDDASEVESRDEAAKQYVAMLERFSTVAESIGMTGLKSIFTQLINFFSHHSVTDELTPEQQLWLTEWPAFVQNYLTNPYQYAMDLALHCRSSNAVISMSETEAAELEKVLLNPQITIDEDTEPRQTKAEPDDVSLKLPEDVNQQLLESLLQELPHQTADFSAAISRIISGDGTLQDVELAQRVAHTLKGSANTVGVKGIATLTHHIEDILTIFSKQKQLPQPPMTTTLQEAADNLEMMSESLLGMGTVPDQQSLDVLQKVLDWANLIEQNGLPESATESGAALPESSKVAEENASPALADGVEQTTLRISTLTIDEILRLVGEGIILNGQLHETLHNLISQNRVIQEQSVLFQQLAFDLEQVIDIRGINNLLSNTGDSKFDALEMDQYNELHTLARRLVEATTDAREMTQTADDELKHLETLLHGQSRIEKDTQETVMKTRMLPVQTIVPRLQRSVRQVGRQTGKDVELEITGTETLIDSDILNMLADPLMHILRNAVDHGIEVAGLRQLEGKPEKGLIKLDFSREGEYIRIRCKDDGAGLDIDSIRQMAMSKGLISKDAQLTDNELSRFILIAGFTTREETTQVSGRGIGMDAVYNQVLKMKGTLKIDTEHGQGTSIEVQLPVTLITLHGIMVQVRDSEMALSNRGVTQILHNSAGCISEEDNQLYYKYDEENYKAFYIEDLLGVMRSKQDVNETNCSALLLSGEDGKLYVVLVGKIVATRDLVIKKLGPYVPAIAGVEGATILGGGDIAPVIDLPSLLNTFQGSNYVPILENSEITGIQSGAPKVLVVDDSLSARRSLAEFMQDVGYRVVTARDGMDAVDKLEDELPDVLLVDMEMPRMNGLELTSYVRANPATHNLPIIMITSRATKKHRNEADMAGVNDYLVKPYSENEVLDVVEAQLKRAFDVNKTATN